MTVMTYPRRELQQLDEAMLLSIPEGRYAWQPDSETPLTFIWIRDYTFGKRLGSRRIRTQHGPWFEDALTRQVSGKITIWDSEIENVLVGVFCGRNEAAMRYATELGNCCRCNADLTLERSRFYGIGPECEELRPDYMDDVILLKGTYEESLQS